MSQPYYLRQTKPDQIMTHWSTCYTQHSACMERKVQEMTEEIQAQKRQAGHFEQLAERMGELNGQLLEEIQTLQVDGSAYALGYQRADDAARAVIEDLRAEIERLKRDR